MPQEAWPKVAVVGAGAVGSWFGGRLADAGADVVLVARAAHAEAIERDGLVVESARGSETIRVRATTDLAAARDAALVLVCVKTPDTENVARELAPHLALGATVLSLQNGVDNIERMRKAAGIDGFPAVVYVAVDLVAPGRLRHTGRGDLTLGDLGSGEAGAESGAATPGRRARLEAAARAFERAGVPCTVSDGIERELWTKMTMNCAFNAVSALTGMRYAAMVDDPSAREWMAQAALETVAVARALGVELDGIAMLEAVWKLAAAMPEATSSTAQDLARGRNTEIDSLNGYVARAGERLDVPTPINRMLADRVRAAAGA
jgi:2-dehydropantoate 2-reductase